MNWVLTARDCEFMLGAARLSAGNVANAKRVAQHLMQDKSMDPSIQASPRPAVQRRAGQPSPLPSTHTSPQRPSTLTAATTQQLLSRQFNICGISPPSTGGSSQCTLGL